MVSAGHENQQLSPSPTPAPCWINLSQGRAGCYCRGGQAVRTGTAWRSWHYLEQSMKKAMPRALSKITEFPVADNQEDKYLTLVGTNKTTDCPEIKKFHGKRWPKKPCSDHTQPWRSRSSRPCTKLPMLRKNQRGYLWAASLWLHVGRLNSPNINGIPQGKHRSSKKWLI